MIHAYLNRTCSPIVLPSSTHPLVTDTSCNENYLSMTKVFLVGPTPSCPFLIILLSEWALSWGPSFFHFCSTSFPISAVPTPPIYRMWSCIYSYSSSTFLGQVLAPNRKLVHVRYLSWTNSWCTSEREVQPVITMHQMFASGRPQQGTGRAPALCICFSARGKLLGHIW